MNEIIKWEDAMKWSLDEVLLPSDIDRIEKVNDGTPMGAHITHEIIFLAIMRKAGGELQMPEGYK
jgi:hypothetical protein